MLRHSAWLFAALLSLSGRFAFAGDLPLQGSDIAVRWDSLYNFLLWLSVFFFVLVVGAMLYFAVKYKDRPGIKVKYITGNHLLEGAWIAIPTILLLIIFAWGFSVYHAMTQAPSDAYEIKVIGKQWLWTFQYPDGRSTVGEVYAPLNKPVKMLMSSEDVLHSFFIPNFRIKQDVVPGMYTSVWFEARVPGKHQIFCAEYCGTSHSGMLAKLVVLDDQQWKDWNAGKKLGPIPDAGRELTAADIKASESSVTLTKVASLAEQGRGHFETKGCVACHTTDGTTKVGPSLKGMFGSKVELADGTFVLADAEYVRESIEQPQAKLVKGFGGLMPTFKGVLQPAEINALVEYIKTLK
jgi:cytochrome c oxidase subunit 2